MKIKRSLFVFAAAALLGVLDVAAAPIPNEARINGFAIGCQAYSFNRFSVFEAIEKTAETGGKVIEFYPGQMLTKEERNIGELMALVEPDDLLHYGLIPELVGRLPAKSAPK